jgi:hypothetical protein
MAQQIYSPQQYTPTGCEGDPDTLLRQMKVLKNDWSYSHHHRQGHPRVEDAPQVQVQAQVDRELVLPVHEVSAKYSRYGRRGNLERIRIGSLVDSSMRGISPTSQHGLNL